MTDADDDDPISRFHRMYLAKTFGERWDRNIRSAVANASVEVVARRLRLSEREVRYIVEESANE